MDEAALQTDQTVETSIEQQGQEEQQQGKSFTQDEVNKMIAKEKAKAASKAEKAAYESDDFKAFRQWQESNKTDQQKQQEQFEQQQQAYQQLATERDQLTKQLACLKAGVKDDMSQDVLALAGNYMNDEVGIDEAIKLVVEKYPHFTNDVKQEEVKPFQFQTKTTPQGSSGISLDKIKGMSPQEVKENWAAIQSQLKNKK